MCNTDVSLGQSFARGCARRLKRNEADRQARANFTKAMGKEKKSKGSSRAGGISERSMGLAEQILDDKSVRNKTRQKVRDRNDDADEVSESVFLLLSPTLFTCYLLRNIYTKLTGI